jgi:hypothetical protein
MSLSSSLKIYNYCFKGKEYTSVAAAGSQTKEDPLFVCCAFSQRASPAPSVRFFLPIHLRKLQIDNIIRNVSLLSKHKICLKTALNMSLTSPCSQSKKNHSMSAAPSLKEPPPAPNVRFFSLSVHTGRLHNDEKIADASPLLNSSQTIRTTFVSKLMWTCPWLLCAPEPRKTPFMSALSLWLSNRVCITES